MASKLLLPQEIETFYVIPSLRRQLALCLKEKGMKQKDIAQLLGIDTAAVSQYLSANTIVPKVRGEAQGAVSLHRIHTLVLKGIGPYLIMEPDATSFLTHIQQDASTCLGYTLQGECHLLATVTAQAAKDIPREAFAVDPHQY